MNLIDEIDLITSTGRQVLGIFQQFPGIVDPGTRRRIYLDKIHKPVFTDFVADRTLLAWCGANALLTIQGLCDNSGNRGFAYPARTRKQVRMMQTAFIKSMTQRTHHMLLSHKGVKTHGAQFTC